MRTKTTCLLLFSSLLSLSACKDEPPGEAIDRTAMADDLVATVCTPFAACDCENEAAIDENNDCAAAVRPAIEASLANAEDLGMRYHGSCRSRLDQYLERLSCDALDELDGDALAEAAYELEHCKIVAGDGGRGDPCETVTLPAGTLLGDTCRHNLVCDGSLCRPVPNAEGDWCGGLFTCPPELACLDPDGDGVLRCTTPAGENQRCNPHDVGGCATDLYCDEDAECEELPDEGDDCPQGVCKEGLACIASECEELPGEGDACPMFVCEEGLICDPVMNVCEEAPDDEGDECPAGICGPGLTCGLDGTCEEVPAAVCSVAESVGFCLYRGDGICDEPEGTGLCEEGTDPSDCDDDATASGPTSDSFTTGPTSDSFTTGPTSDSATSGPTDSFTSDSFTSGDTSGLCPYQGDGECDEPEGTGLCPEGTDPDDCAGTSAEGSSGA